MLFDVLRDIDNFGGTYNLGSGIGHSSKEIVLKVSELLTSRGYVVDLDKQIQYIKMKQEIDSSILDCSKYLSRSISRPFVPLANGIDEMITLMK